jgi:putative ABC transport system permease protein
MANWRQFFRRSRWDEERKQELQDYLAHEIDDNVARGMTPEDARRAAHRQLGNVTRIREDIYDMNSLPLVDAAWQDLRYGLRLLLKNRTFALVAIMTLALGTGANAAIFQLVNAVRLRTLQVQNPHELVSVGINNHGKGRTGRGYSGRSIFTEPIYRELQRQQQAFSTIFVWGSDTWDLAREGEVQLARGFYVSGNYFDALGVRPHVGRVLTEADDQKGCGTPSVVLSHGFWQARYGGNPQVVGQSISIDKHAATIVGVAPADFSGTEVGRSFDLLVPMCAEPMIRGPQATGTGRQHVWWLDVMGRLKPGWDVERAAAHLDGISGGVFTATVSPQYNAGDAADFLAFKFTAQSAATGVSNLRRQYATPIWVLLGATGLVLLIACANLANLMLARAATRDREIAVRLAIGASRGRVVRQLLAESLVIAALGAAAGMLLAGWLSQTLVAVVSTNSNRLAVDLSPDWRTFAFTTAIAVFACLLFGLSPALKATRTHPAKALNSGGRSGTEGQEAFALRRLLVVVQVALSLVLVVGALLFTRSLQNLANVETGFRPEGLVRASVDVRASGFEGEALSAVFDRLVAAVSAVPGVEHAANALIIPMTGPGWNQRVLIGGVAQDGLSNFNQIGPTFFETMATPLVAGRAFDSRDRVGSPRVAIVNETFARKYFPNQSPLGKAFEIDSPPGEPRLAFEVVGVVRNSKYSDLREEPIPIGYFPVAQATDLEPGIEIVVRSNLALASLTPALTRAIVEIAPGASVLYRPLPLYLRDSLATERVMASLSGFFGVLAVLIATLGLYGVVTYMVTRRQTEIGVRMALGADPQAVVRMVLKDAGSMLGIGSAIGVILAVLSAKAAASLLFGVRPWDPASFALAAGSLAIVTLVAAWIPARRASRMSPTTALRQ